MLHVCIHAGPLKDELGEASRSHFEKMSVRGKKLFGEWQVSVRSAFRAETPEALENALLQILWDMFICSCSALNPADSCFFSLSLSRCLSPPSLTLHLCFYVSFFLSLSVPGPVFLIHSPLVTHLRLLVLILILVLSILLIQCSSF